eukprot:403371755
MNIDDNDQYESEQRRILQQNLNCEQCSKPIHYWLLVTIFLVAVLRGLILILEKTNQNRIFRITALSILLVFFPTFIIWTLVGTSWFNSIHKETPECIADNVRWVTVFWISIAFFLIFTYIATVLTLMLEQCSGRSLEGYNNQDQLSNQERLIQSSEGLNSQERQQIEKRNYDSWFDQKLEEKLNESSNLSSTFRQVEVEIDNCITPVHYRERLTERHLNKEFPNRSSSMITGLHKTASELSYQMDNQLVQTVISEIDNICPICHLDFERNDQVKIMPECYHTYHIDCIDQWLKLKSRCPMCNKNPKLALKMDKYKQAKISKEFIERQNLKQEFINGLRECIIQILNECDYLILQYGSSFLMAETQESDYDLILVNKLNDLQQTCENSDLIRQQFLFEKLAEQLNMNFTIKNLEIFKIKHAKVPILKMKYKQQINIDLSLAIVCNTEEKLSQISIQNYLLFDNQSEVSINAVIQSQEIKNLVAGCNVNFELFGLCLQHVKTWAQRRKVYGQQYGYLGGIAFAILCANIVQAYQNDDKFMCYLNDPNIKHKQKLKYFLLKFFKFYSSWEWPNPIILDQGFYDQENLLNPNGQQVKMNVKKIWNPISCIGDSQHLMPIISPQIKINTQKTITSTNTADQVLNSNLQIYLYEFKRAYKIMKKIYKGKIKLKELGSAFESFIKDGQLNTEAAYNFAITIQVNSKGLILKDNDIYELELCHNKIFKGIEAKLRSLLTSLDNQFNHDDEFRCLIRPLKNDISIDESTKSQTNIELRQK